MRTVDIASLKDKFPIIFALIAQLISVFIIMKFFREYFPPGQPIRFLIGHASLAFLFSQFVFRLPRWWGWIAIFFPAMVILSVNQMSIQSWMYLVFFAIVLLFFSNTLIDRVPLYLTNRQTNQALIELCDRLKIKSIVDLGCGFGGVVRALSVLPNSNVTWGRRASGVESALMSWLISDTLSRVTGKGKIFRKNIWNFELGDYDGVYVFLSPIPMEKIYNKFLQEMKSGSYLISNSFPVPNIQPIEVIELKDQRKTKLYVYSK